MPTMQACTVATPTGQLLVWHMRAAMQPTACMAEFDTATASAPSAIVFTQVG